MFEPGSQIGRYEIQRRLGRGGMGTVYVAHDPVLGRMVAIKVFAGDLDVPDARERFSREARAAAAINHPNIVTIHDFGELDAQPYIVMEYVAGETLAGLIRRKGPVSMGDKLRWMEELSAGASYAHQMQVVHRDIKPANLMIDRTGRLKILDFGIARMLGIASNTSVMIGTPGYMAPEQITGDAVDHRADQFSIGVVFYELLAYTEAFPGDTLPTITHKILATEPAALDELVPDAGPEIAEIVARALKKQPADRFADAEALRVAISRVRRQFSSNAAWNAPTIAPGPDTPPAGSRGTGSARRRQDDAAAVAQLTPPPDPRRTDREAIARRRTVQIEASLQQARRLLAQDQLDAALEACQQALILDETHVGALDLEQEIQARLGSREEEGLASALTAAADFGAGSARDPRSPSEHPNRPGRDEVTAGMIDAGDRTALRLPVAHADATIVAPARRTPAPVPSPAAMPPAPSAPVAKPKTPADRSPMPKAPPAAPVGRKVRTSRPPGAGGMVARVQALVSSPRAAVLATALRDRRVMWSAAGVLALGAIAAVAWMFTGGVVATGSVVVDAAPWGSITAIESETGRSHPLPSETATPVSLTLPAGAYEITVAGPTPGSQPQRVSVRVEAGAGIVAPLVRFSPMTPEEYFEQYLGASPVPEPSAAPAEPGAAPTGVDQ